MRRYSRIWGFDENFTLEKVQELQSKGFQETVDYLQDFKTETPYDRTLMHRWEIDKTINIYTTPDNTKIRYYKAKAIFEKTIPKADAFYDSNFKILLPREKRIYENDALAIFVEQNNRIYALVSGSRSCDQVRTILMGAGMKDRKRPEWGKINCKLQQYKLESDFFYWLFYKYQTRQAIKTNLGLINIDDIEGIGRYSARKQHDTKLKGSKCLDEISNKSALGINQFIYETDITFVYSNLEIIASLSGFSEAIIDFNRSRNITETDQFQTPDEPTSLLKLYLEIIPGLNLAYNSDRKSGKWDFQQSSLTQKQWALDVIEELSQHHKLSKSDILGLKCFAC